MPPKFATIDAYLAVVRDDQRAALESLRSKIRAAAPGAVEGFSYGMPAFLLGGKAIAGFAAFKNHLSYFPMSGRVVAALARDLRGFHTSKGAIQFTPEKALPAALVKKLVKARIAELGGPAVKPTRAKKAKAFPPDDSVDQFLRDLDHPLKAEYVLVRKLILGIDPSIGEGVKWNAPSFRTADYFATVHLRSRDAVQLIFHTGAKAKGLNLQNKNLPDPNGLIEWLAKDRCLVTLGPAKGWKANRPAFVALVKAWIGNL